MTGGNARRGRRDNGLQAAIYAVVGDVDPRVGEHLLDVLGNRGIAAYLQPTVDQNPVTRVTTLPGRPTDRLFVDRAELETAREFLAILARDGDGAVLTPEPADGATTSGSSSSSVSPTSAPPAVTPPGANQPASAPSGSSAADKGVPASSDSTGSGASRPASEFEAAWASIVAGFDTAAISGQTPWPAIEDLTTHNGSSASSPPADPTPAGPTATTSRDWPRWNPPVQPDNASLLDGLDSFGADLPDDDEDDYQPPPPPPLPHLATITILGLVGIVGGILVILYPALLPGLTSTSAAVLGCMFIIAGGVALIGRLRSGADDDEPEGPDNGAVV